jgi:hypothetical protein
MSTRISATPNHQKSENSLSNSPQNPEFIILTAFLPQFVAQADKLPATFLESQHPYPIHFVLLNQTTLSAVLSVLPNDDWQLIT